MVWVLSAALAAGILHRGDVLALAFAILLVVCWRGRPDRSNAAGVVVLCLLVFAYGARDTISYRARCAVIDSVSVRAQAPIYCDGLVSGYPEWSAGGTRFEFDTILGGFTHKLLVKANVFDLAYGDSLRILLRLDAPQRTRGSDYLRGRGVTGSGRAVRGGVEHLRAAKANTVRRFLLWPIHRHLRRILSRGCGARAGVPMALLLGERGYLDRRTRDAFSTLGISHLLALSGFHLGFVTAALLGLMKLCRVRSRAGVVASLILYVGIVGAILSLYRALVMVVLLVVAARIRRPLRPVTALGDAFLLMLLCFPFALYSLGFQLSFMATLAVLVCVEHIRPVAGRSRLRKIVHGTVTTLWVSAFVQLWVAPILLGSFGGMSVVAPIATILFTLPVLVTLALSAAAVTAGTIIPWGVAGGAFTCLGGITALFEDALRIAVAHSPSLVELPAPQPVLYYIGLCTLVFRRGNLWITSAGVLAVAISCAIPWFSK